MDTSIRDADDDARIEHRAMDITRWANLGMGLAGAGAAWASNSQALLIDGLFSLIGYISAVFAMRISKTAHLGPDRLRPFGHAPEEVLYATFRSLALIGLVIFGIVQAVMGITDYVINGDVEEVRLVPVAIYSTVVATLCFWLAHVHRRAWIRTGRKSDMLQLEITASVYDGIITLLAGVGLLAAPLLLATFLAPLTPIMDSLIVLVLCGVAIFGYLKAFQKGIAQLAGAPARAADQLAIRRKIKPLIEEQGGILVDVAAVRLGRKLDIVVYFDPLTAIAAEAVDTLTDSITMEIERGVGSAQVLVVMSQKGRETPSE